MYYIESDSTDPYYNLALEQYVFDRLSTKRDIFMLWRNDNTIVVGKHQNTMAEVNADFVRQNGIRVVRRLSGGGAVYHDLGNVNFTCINEARTYGAFDFASFCRPVIRALNELGVNAELNGRNDMTIDGKKFSGNAQYRKDGRTMHHGTILYDADLDVVGQALVVSKDKIASKGVKSVRSRVTNVKPHMRQDMPVEQFMGVLREAMFREFAMQPYALDEQDREAVRTLQKDVYETWDWNYGRSPACNIVRERRVEGVGTLAAHMDVDKGLIRNIIFFGDYFSSKDTAVLAATLTGCRLEAEDMARALESISIGEYFHNLNKETFIEILTG